jgi:Na+/H+ antiporter NhaD/arsenite permease-like protein
MHGIELTTLSYVSIAVLIVVYFFLITEKLNKVIVTGLGATFVILAQLFQGKGSPQEIGFEYIHHNLDVLGFVIGMMVLVGIVRESGFFEAVAIWLVKVVKGNPFWLLVSLCYLTLLMTSLLSNIPTVLILTPIVLILVRELKLPLLPFLIGVVTFANIGGAMTPISDPTTYYEAKTVGLSFIEVVENSGVGVWLMSFTSIAYLLLLFRKPLAAVKVSAKDVAAFKPASAIKNKKIMAIGLPLLFGSILVMILKESIASYTGIHVDNASVVLFASLIAMLVFKKEPRDIFMNIIDWEIIFFFMGLFVTIGALEHNGVISALGLYLVDVSKGSVPVLLFLLSVGSGILSTFIDNVPYNITMVSAVQAMAKAGIAVYPLWWALNLGTSLGGAGSPIGAACNVVAVGIAEKEGKHVKFMKYFLHAFPLVVINALVAFAFLYVKFFIFHAAE